MMSLNALKQQLSTIQTKRVVTEQRGSWKWQDAFRISYYHAYPSEDGRILWKSFSQSRKYSWPQITVRGWTSLDKGSIHRQAVSREDAIEVIGKRSVTAIERNGWKFA